MDPKEKTTTTSSTPSSNDKDGDLAKLTQGKLNWADAVEDVDEPAPLAIAKEQNLVADDVVIDQSNPNSPLFSVKSFNEMGLPEELLKGVYAMKFTKPSKIQETALPIVLGVSSQGIKPQNLIAQAQSGTGKTTVFSLAMLNKVDPKLEHPQCLCVCPVRELARQIADVITQMGQFTKIKVQLVVPDAEIPPKVTAQILVGTPGRFFDLLKKDLLKMKQIRMFVLDEADQMLDLQGLSDQTQRLQKQCPPDCQILLFSATYKPEIAQFAEKIVPKPAANIRLTRKELTLENITQLFIDCKTEDAKFEVLAQIYEHISVGQSIVFLHKKETLKQLAAKMQAAGHVVSVIHGDLEPKQRDDVIDNFRRGKSKVLMATNVLSRGIDILQVSLVINYDLPMRLLPHQRSFTVDPETYLHRIGRTGRWARQGIAINFVHDDKSRRDLQELERFFGIKMKKLERDHIPDLTKMLKNLKNIPSSMPPTKDS